MSAPRRQARARGGVRFSNEDKRMILPFGLRNVSLAAQLKRQRKQPSTMKTMADETTTNQDATDKFESGKTHARQAAEELRGAAEAKARELRATAEAKAQEYREKAEHAFEDARARARTLREDGEQYVRENPLRTVFTALGVGFVLGLIFRR
jgi:ElaB/YqjD/DUF883 family membrane-anchored ribosome-binding protein